MHKPKEAKETSLKLKGRLWCLAGLEEVQSLFSFVADPNFPLETNDLALEEETWTKMRMPKFKRCKSNKIS